MKKHRVKALGIMLLIFLAGKVAANGIAVGQIALTGENTTGKYINVQFDLSWQNSWRFSGGPANRDAAWVFVKYRIKAAYGGDGRWKHATLNTTGHYGGAGTGDTLETAPDGTGVFISRVSGGAGTFAATGVRLRWNYGVNGVADTAHVDIKVFAIEMVYVPEGSFYAGSGGTESGSFTDGSWTNGSSVPLQITSENTLAIEQSAGNLWGTSTSGNNTIGGTGTLAAVYPKGYGAFYCMKYEISQQQYVDFLNTLSTLQAGNRYSGANTGNRYGITVDSGVYSTTKPYVACNFMSWMDGAAFADWAGLRPMTELEYEKACRGAHTPVAAEYAWGSTLATAANDITNDGAANESTATSGANIAFSDQANVQGPLRVGVFATSATISSEMAGATYYGIMEMSGNLWERTVTVGNAAGRSFTGIQGNGLLSEYGNADVTAWPGLASGEVTGATGSGFRGGSYSATGTTPCISDRQKSALVDTQRAPGYGFRAVRSHP